LNEHLIDDVWFGDNLLHHFFFVPFADAPDSKIFDLCMAAETSLLKAICRGYLLLYFSIKLAPACFSPLFAKVSAIATNSPAAL
jgi:hypothetical protein